MLSSMSWHKFHKNVVMQIRNKLPFNVLGVEINLFSSGECDMIRKYFIIDEIFGAELLHPCFENCR